MRHSIVGASIARPLNFSQKKALLHILFFLRKAKAERKGKKLKQEEKKPIPWEVADPKPPVVRSGKMGNRKQN